MTDKLDRPSTITLLPLPPRSPELNLMEDISPFLRDNRIFKTRNDTLDHCCDAWNALADRSWKNISIGIRQWAREF